MRPAVAAAFLCLIGLADGRARSEPALPSWNEGDQEMLDTGLLVPGSVLLGTETVNPETGHSNEVSAVPAPEPAEEIEELVEPPSEIPEEFLAAYFDTSPAEMLIDPQRLLSQQEFADQLAFLRYHSGDSEVDLFVYLFDALQEIPSQSRIEQLLGEFFCGDRPAAVVFYFVGAPQRSSIRLSSHLTGLVSASEQRRMLSSSVTKALEKANLVDQLEGFAVQLSIRLYWVEKAFAGTPQTAEPLVVLKEKPKPESEEDRLLRLIGVIRPWAMTAGAWLGGLSAALIGWLLVRRHLRYRFPELEVSPRLGGEHAAGIGAVVTFGSAGLPPSYQRAHVPDYLRRM